MAACCRLQRKPLQHVTLFRLLFAGAEKALFG